MIRKCLTLLGDSLQGNRYSFIGAQSGQEGLALARQVKPHAITLDIMMPHMDGWSVLQILKNDPELRAIPVFIISIMENKALGFSLGATDYIVKPFDRKDLLSKLKTCMKSSPSKVLIVDDEPGMTRLLSDALKQEGYRVATSPLTAARRSDTRQKKAGHSFPGFDDAEMQRLRRSRNHPEKSQAAENVRVFVMTAKHLTPQETHYLEQRVEMIVQKGSRNFREILKLLKVKLSMPFKEAVVP